MDFYITQVKHLPTQLYNAAWRWQYMKHRAIARHFNNIIYRLTKRTPKLYYDGTANR